MGRRALFLMFTANPAQCRFKQETNGHNHIRRFIATIPHIARIHIVREKTAPFENYLYYRKANEKIRCIDHPVFHDIRALHLRDVQGFGPRVLLKVSEAYRGGFCPC